MRPIRFDLNIKQLMGINYLKDLQIQGGVCSSISSVCDLLNKGPHKHVGIDRIIVTEISDGIMVILLAAEWRGMWVRILP